MNQQDIDNKFRDFLDKNHEDVKSWPEWKRNVSLHLIDYNYNKKNKNMKSNKKNKNMKSKVSDKIKKIIKLAKELFDKEGFIDIDDIYVSIEYLNGSDVWSVSLMNEIVEEIAVYDYLGTYGKIENKTLLRALNQLYFEIEKRMQEVELKNKPKIRMIRETGKSGIGSLYSSYKNIVNTLQCLPNCTDLDDFDKVKASWGFEDDNGRKAFIWSYGYDNPEKCNMWSIDGNPSLLRELFGKDKIK